MTSPIRNFHEIHCEVCGESTRVPGYGQQYGTLEAHWGMARTMMVTTTAFACVSRASLPRWPTFARSGGSTGSLMTIHLLITRHLAKSRATTGLASRDLT